MSQPDASGFGRKSLAALALSAVALVGIVTNEGYTDKAVRPLPGDVPTLGFGTTRHADGSPVKMGETTTPPQALARALQDVRQFEGALKRCVKVPLHQWEYDAYVDFSYNVGSANFCSSTLVRKLNAGDYDGACRQILEWKMFQKRDCSIPANKCRGLWERRQREYRTCRGGAP